MKASFHVSILYIPPALAILLAPAAPSDARADAVGRLARAEQIEELCQLYHSPDGLAVDAQVEGSTAVAYGRTSDCGIRSGIYPGAAAARYSILRDAESRAALEKAVQGITLFGLGVDGFVAVMDLAIFRMAAHATGDPEIENFYTRVLIGKRHSE